MAKKIKIDFSKVEERSGWNTRQIPAGIHKMKVTAVQQTEAQDGTPMLVYALKPADARYTTRLFPYYCKQQQNQLWKLRDLLVAAGETIPKKAVQIDPEKIIGRFVAAEVEDDMYNGNVRSQIQGVFGTDILEDDEDDQYDEDDQDYDEDLDDPEDDYDEDDLDDSEEEDFDDENFDDDEDDEDWDDEDDFDDEEEEEEPEPEPAPKKKPAPKKRVVRKSPRKSSK